MGVRVALALGALASPVQTQMAYLKQTSPSTALAGQCRFHSKNSGGHYPCGSRNRISNWNMTFIRCGLKPHWKESRSSKAKHCAEQQLRDMKWAPRNSERAKRALRRATSINHRRRRSSSSSGNEKEHPPRRKQWAMTVVEALIECIHKKHWQQAIKVFGMLREQSWYEPKISTYRKLLVLLGRCRQPDQAYSLFQMMKEEGCELNAEVYTALVSAYCKSGLLDKAFAILEEMKSIPQCEPDVFTYSVLIEHCLEASMFEYVDRLLKEMTGHGILPSTVTKNILIDGYGKAGMFEEMENILSQMLTDDTCKPDEWTMNAVLRVFGNIGEIETMEEWYKRFQNIGIQPDTRTFEILISSYGKECFYDKMAAVMEYMQKSSFSWTTTTYNVLIDAFGRAGEIKQMEFVFNQMRLEGVKPDCTTFSSLISFYAEAGIFDQILKIVHYVENSDILPNTPFFNSVLDACRRAGNFSEMWRVFKEMKDRGCTPDQKTFTIMIEAYLNEGMTDKVQELEQEMQNMLLSAGQGSVSVKSLVPI